MPLKDIGNPIMMSNRIDTEGYMSEYIRASMMVIDMIPTDQQVNLLQINRQTGLSTVYEFDEKIRLFKELCASYHLDNQYDGLRLWCTDETVMQDEFSNQYSQNFLQSIVDKAANVSRYLNLLREAQRGEVNLREQVSKLLDGLAGYAGKLSPEGEAIVKEMGDVVIKGKHIGLPKVWSSSDYNPAINLNIKLVTPYGSPRAVRRFLIEPLAYLLLLTSPISENGITYGYPSSLYIKAYGIATIKCGYIENVSIRRGGADLTYNQYRQPMMLNITVTVRPQVQGFASIHNAPDYDVRTTDQSASEGLEVISNGGMHGAVINTVGDILDSMRPFQYNSANRQEHLETARQQTCVENMPSRTQNLTGAITRESRRYSISEQEERRSRRQVISYDQSGNPVQYISDIVRDAIENDMETVIDILHDETTREIFHSPVSTGSTNTGEIGQNIYNFDEYLHKIGKLI